MFLQLHGEFLSSLEEALPKGQTTSDPAAPVIEQFRTQINGGAPSTDDLLPAKLNLKPALITYCPDPKEATTSMVFGIF
jgi:hypothetical protein